MLRDRILACLLLTLAPAYVEAQLPPADKAARAAVRLFDSWRDTDSPGCAVGVRRAGETVFERGFGMANLETGTPIQPGTVFHAASIAKQVTAMAVLLLAAEGKLALDDDVRRWIPELPAYGAPITLRHLLTHTSGLRDYVELLTLARGRFEEDRITEADLLDIVVRQKSLNHPPGAEYLYTNTGFALAAILVKRVSGKSLRQFAADRLFGPLAMSSTTFRDSYTMLVPNRASGYARAGEGWRTSTPNYDVYGATGLLTTVRDLLAWTENLAKPIVGDTAMVRQMTTSAVLSNGDSTGYGLGVALVSERGTRILEHEGSDPGFRAYLGRYPDEDLAVAVLCNTNTANPVSLGRGVADLFRGLAPDAQPVAQVSRSSAPLRIPAATRAGVYFQPTRVEVVELAWRDGSLRSARGNGATLTQLDDSTFAVAGRPVMHVFTGDARSGYVARALLPGRHPVAFEWKEPFVMKAGALKAYEGEYVSEELDAVYRVSVTDSTLVLRTRASTGLVARPVFAHTFVSGQYTVEFTLRGQEVVGFRISHPRARRVEFSKLRAQRGAGRT